MSTIKTGTTLTTAYQVEGDTTGALTIQTGSTPTTAVTIGSDQSFNFSATGQRITGDFSNATVANRVMFQTSTTNGNSSVAVLPNGTSLVSGLLAFNNSDPTNAAFVQMATTAGIEARFLSGITGTGTYLPMTFYTGGSERMRIDTSGNVGIGTSSPGAKLHVFGAEIRLQTDNDYLSFYNTSGTRAGYLQGNSPNVTLAADAGSVSLNAGGANNLLFNTNSTERMRIDSSGNVGIGTNSPAYPLDVLKTTAGATTRARIFNPSTTASSVADLLVSVGPANSYVDVSAAIAGAGIVDFGADLTGGYIRTLGAAPLVFVTNNTERMRIDSSGIVTGTAGNLMLVSGTAVASTSGTSITFTSIPSWVKRITVIFNGVSTNGSSLPQVQIGSGSVDTTGYNSGALVTSSTNGGTVNASTGYLVSAVGAAAYAYTGHMILTNVSGNIWIASGVANTTASVGLGSQIALFAGTKTLSGTLDRVRITTVNGTDTFDAGSINIMYE